MDRKMIPIYGSLITILLCVFLPPLFDHFKGDKDEWSWRRAVAAYSVMTGFVLVLPVLIGGSVYIGWAFAMLAVAVAVFIAPVSFLGTSFVLVLSNIILPTLILWEISRYNKVQEPMRMIINTVEWPGFLAPLVLGLLTLFAARKLCRRFGSE
jgi:hypothetical protein